MYKYVACNGLMYCASLGAFFITPSVVHHIPIIIQIPREPEDKEKSLDIQ